MTRASIAAALLALLAGSCVSGNKIRADSEIIKADLERARRNGAMRCAPRELATAEANLDFAQEQYELKRVRQQQKKYVLLDR